VRSVLTSFVSPCASSARGRPAERGVRRGSERTAALSRHQSTAQVGHRFDSLGHLPAAAASASSKSIVTLPTASIPISNGSIVVTAQRLDDPVAAG
jgi:hypothetical protein